MRAFGKRMSTSRLTAAPNALSSSLSQCGLSRGLRATRRGDRGATAVEYAMMTVFIVIVATASIILFGERVAELFEIPPGYF